MQYRLTPPSLGMKTVSQDHWRLEYGGGVATLTCDGASMIEDDGAWFARCPFQIPEECRPQSRIGTLALMGNLNINGAIVVSGGSAYVVCYQQTGLNVNIATITWRYQ